MRRFLKISAVSLIALYLGALLLLYLVQRRLEYFPSSETRTPAEAGLPAAETLSLKTADGETLEAWHVAAKPGKPTILYFHGNGGRLYFYARRFERIVEAGNGLLAISYRGYGNSTGTPTEPGLREDADTAYRYLEAQRVPASSIVVFGDSLGSAMAIGLAAKHRFAAIVLDSPFSSAADVAAARYPIFPVRFLMSDTYRSVRAIRSIHTPLLILHGTDDAIVPIRFGRKLFRHANDPREMIEIEGGAHVVTRDPVVLEKAIAFIGRIAIDP